MAAGEESLTARGIRLKVSSKFTRKKPVVFDLPTFSKEPFNFEHGFFLLLRRSVKEGCLKEKIYI